MDGCPIPPTYVLFTQHHRVDVESREPRYIHKMIIYNKLSHMADNDRIRDEDVVMTRWLKMR
uniref:Uncharacterized protein n=1 Tax=Medicago truncatula TaxID=3880 RepID=Q2HT98_MEDTR|nr:hypothetical protein MtrDRAFT_AC150776g28v2 [Medicago truncatula]